MQETRLNDRLRRHRIGGAVYQLVDNLDRHHATLAASAMAFDAFLSLIPLAAAAGAIFARLHEAADVVLAPLLKTAPAPVRTLVDEAFFRLSDTTSAVLAPISLGAFLWVSSSGLSTAMSIFEAVFHSPPRPWWWRRLIAMACVIGIVAFLAIVVAAAILFMTISGSWGARAVALGVPLVVVVVMLAAFFRLAIRGPRPRERRIFPGALVTVTLWTIVSAAFSLYVSTLARYATLYGGLAAVAILLFWLWLLALALLCGGEINAQLEGARDIDAMNSMPPSKSTAMPAALFTPLPLPKPPAMPALSLLDEGQSREEEHRQERDERDDGASTKRAGER